MLCKNCHDDYEQKAIQLKKEGVKRFGIPLEGSGWVYLPEYKRAKKAASALLRSSEKIPQERQEILKAQVLEFWESYDKKTEDASLKEILETCSVLEDHFKGPDYIEHGHSAIQQLMENCIKDEQDQETWPDLEKFIKQWRQHFLDNLKPKFLSPKWSVNNNIYSR